MLKHLLSIIQNYLRSYAKWFVSNLIMSVSAWFSVLSRRDTSRCDLYSESSQREAIEELEVVALSEKYL